ncbi:MAG: hypothetical protein H6R00_358 [Proteobacteria bacterium]|nr:hypothetical protein [Pseudomonadota bacterium]
MNQNAFLPINTPRPSARLITLKELAPLEGGTPRTVTFADFAIKPLSYEDLATAKLHRPVTIPLEMYNGRIVESDVEGIDTGKYAHFTTTLESPFTAQAIGLVRGGWLPSALAATREKAVLLPDRNIISKIAGQFENGIKVDSEADFLDLFADEPIWINPLLSALEGNKRAVPTSAAARTQLEEGVEKLRKALPKATIMVGTRSIEGLLGLIDDTRLGLTRKQDLLRRLAPLLAAPVARRNMDARWAEALAAADEAGVPRNSLVMLAVLSTIVNPQGHCAAKRVLKFHASYSNADAYNALSDLRSLEVLLSCLAFFPDYNIQLCTADRNLALFWVGLGASDIAHDSGRMQYEVRPHAALLPPEYCDRWFEDIGQNGGDTTLSAG